MNLEEEVQRNRRDIRSSGYTMSIGEFVNMYRDEEIVIRPEYQRLFRWSIEQQSRLIESLLLDIPLPPIFVSQREDGVWEVVDGLQRISSILKFMGELRDESTKETVDPQPLTPTRYLKSLNSATWNSGKNAFSNTMRIDFKRARLEIRILLKESDDHLKYELFDRLNSGGSPTSPQEVRTAILLMEHPKFHNWLESLRSAENFSDCIPLTSRQVDEQYDFELALRFVVLNYSSVEKLRGYADMEDILTERSLEIASDNAFKRVNVKRDFNKIFSILNSYGPDVFRKYDSKKGRPVGAFSVSAFEAATQGVAANLGEWSSVSENSAASALEKCAIALWSDPQFTRYSGAGVRATQRIPHMKEVGAKIFKP